MKKVLTVFVVTVLAAGFAIADNSVNVTVETIMDAFYTRTFLGDYAARVSSGPYYYQGQGDIKFFQSSAFDSGLNGRVKFSYSGQRLGGFLELRANTDTAALDDWYYESWVRPANWIRVTAGNRAQTGQIENFQNFSELLKTKIDYLGVLYAEYHHTVFVQEGDNLNTIDHFPWGHDASSQNMGFATFSSSKTNDLFMPAGSNSERMRLNFMADFTFFDMVTLSASLGGLHSSISRPFARPWEYTNRGATRGNFFDAQGDPVLADETAFGVRLEAANIANLVTFAAVYKYAGSSLSKLVTADGNFNDIIDENTGNHTFGLYANISPVSGLEISAGYSGFTQSWRNNANTEMPPDINANDKNNHYLSSFREVIFPFYNGIDLRAAWTGTQNLVVTFHNNISFASINGTDKPGMVNEDGKFAFPWAYRGQLNERHATDQSVVANRSENYFGLYTALGFNYAFTETFSAAIQAANQLGFFTLDWENDNLRSSSNILGLYAGAAFTIIEAANITASLSGGVAARINMNSYQDISANIHQSGVIEFGVPIGIKVQY